MVGASMLTWHRAAGSRNSDPQWASTIFMSFSMLGKRLHFTRCRKSRTCGIAREDCHESAAPGTSTQRQPMLMHARLSAEVKHGPLAPAAADAMLVDPRRKESDPEAYQQLAVVNALHVGVLDGRAAAPLDQPRRLLHELPDALLYQRGAG